jgi:hypothetical protein
MTKKTIAKRGEWATAYHEAGHAVAAFFLGIEIERVTIVPEGSQSLGAVHTLLKFRNSRWLWPGFSVRGFAHPYNMHVKIEKLAIVCIAGGVADLRFWPQRRRLGVGSDLESVRYYLGHVSANGWILKAKMKVAALQAHQFVEDHWGYIAAVAKALMERKTLTPKQLSKVIAKELPKPLS